MEVEQKEVTPAWFDLAPDRKLLDSSFEGYKLSLEPFAQYKLELTNQLKLDTYNYVESQTEPTSHKVFVYQHLKLFGLQNLLVVNQYNDSNVYYFDTEHRLVRINYKQARSLNPTSLKLGNLTQTNRVNPTMKFIGLKLAVVFDGFNTLYICNETEIDVWNILYTWQVGDELKSSIIKDSVLFENKLHVLLMNVQESNSKYDTYVNWVTFETKNTDNTEWLFNYKRLRRINCFNAVPDYVYLETNGQSVYVTGPSTIKFVFDSEKPVSLSKTKPIKKVATSEQMTVDKPVDEIEKFYSWNQTAEEVNLNVKLDKYGIRSKNDLMVNIKLDSIELKTHDNKTILNEKFFSAIRFTESIWTLNTNTNSLEIILAKAKPNEVWPICLQGGDALGEYKLEQMETGLDQFTSETISKGNESKSLFGTLDQQLEECDGLTDDQVSGNVESEDRFIMMRRLDGESHEPSHQCYINDNRYLFDIKLSANKTPAVCLRHDVDGILWQPHRISEPSPTNTIWLTHEHTFLAFGYVQASKQDTKYKSCSPDCSYVTIADTLKHIYVYKQDTETQGSVLKNRKTGKVVSHVGKQYLISLDSDKECYGIYCSNDFLIVILCDVCYLFKMSSKTD